MNPPRCRPVSKNIKSKNTPDNTRIILCRKGSLEVKDLFLFTKLILKLYLQ